MTIDKEKLKAMAECAAGFTDMSLAPDVVLALLAEIEGLHAQHGRDSGELRKLCSARDSARRQRDQLKSENEALRNDAERYRWMRQRHIPLEGHDFLSTQEILDRRIDAAMLKEQPQ
jgi:FtsZ-binding cell division protein ZapB